MRNINFPVRRKLNEYTPQEIKVFDKMHAILTAYNARIGKANELPMPLFTDDQMYAYSIYRELLLSIE